MMKATLSYYYPIILFLIGISIHVINVIRILIGAEESSWWVWWVHTSMLVFNTCMLIGLVLRKNFAYIVSAAGLLAMILFQAINAAIFQTISPITILAWILCILAIPILITSYKKNRQNPVHSKPNEVEGA